MNRFWPMRSGRHGFTLIEVMAVVALIGLMATAAAWSLADDAVRATHADVVDRLRHSDAMVRTAARRFGPSTLHIDLDRQRVWITSPAEHAGQTEKSHALRMPVGYRIEEVAWVDASPVALSLARERRRVIESAGLVELPISAEGVSRSYVIHLSGPKIVEGGEVVRADERQSTWLVFAGMTGQVFEEDDEDTIETIFNQLAGTRPDAD